MRYVSGMTMPEMRLIFAIRWPIRCRNGFLPSNEHQRVAALLTLEEIFGRDLPQNPQFVAHITAAWHQLAAFGARQAIAGTLNA